jgi:hypothetical protein
MWTWQVFCLLWNASTGFADLTESEIPTVILKFLETQSVIFWCVMTSNMRSS